LPHSLTPPDPDNRQPTNVIGYQRDNFYIDACIGVGPVDSVKGGKSPRSST
jgi:hypothetical protein